MPYIHAYIHTYMHTYIHTCTMHTCTQASWSSQYHQQKFAMLHQYNVRIENLVYYRSSGAFSDAATHYFCMTAERESLHAFGVLREAVLEDSESRKDLCAPSNVNLEKLELYARAAIALLVPQVSK